MGRLIGMDEAGYGPNLGPLTIVLTDWFIPGSTHECDLYQLLAETVVQNRTRDDRRLHIADSKVVHSSTQGIAALERSVLSVLSAQGIQIACFSDLLASLAPDAIAELHQIPWFTDLAIRLPLEADLDQIRWQADRLHETMHRASVQLSAIRGEVVPAQRFNRILEQEGTKGVVLSQLSLRLLTEVWDPQDSADTLVIADKHGGRNRYGDLLSDALDGRLVLAREESRSMSRYRVDQSEIIFRTKAECHLPVALASMCAKYIREVCMVLFNRFWQAKVLGLAPTKGYPVDARRFQNAIASECEMLGIAEDILWRNR